MGTAGGLHCRACVSCGVQEAQRAAVTYDAHAQSSAAKKRCTLKYAIRKSNDENLNPPAKGRCGPIPTLGVLIHGFARWAFAPRGDSMVKQVVVEKLERPFSPGLLCQS